ncbi:MAG: hypothetical protein V9F00_02585 [Nocardioides sp.]
MESHQLAVARAADALHAAAGLRAHVGEGDARVAQRRGLARAGRADDHVPGQRVEGLDAALARGLRALERGDGAVELGLDRAHLGLLLGADAARLLLGLGVEGLLDLARGLAGLEAAVEPDREEHEEDEQRRQDRDGSRGA